MSKGLGRALASALGENSQPQDGEGSSKHLFSNLHRRLIFSQLTLTPCMGVGQLAKKLNTSESTVDWHLKSLVEGGYIVEQRAGSRRIFYPQGLIGAEQIEFFRVLNMPRLSELLFIVIEGSGLSQGQVAEKSGDTRQTVSKALGELERVGLVTKVSDGASTRYFTTTLLPDMAREFYQHSKDYTEHMMKRLEAEGGKKPEIVKKGLERIIVELGPAASRFTMEMGINPYITCTSC